MPRRKRRRSVSVLSAHGSDSSEPDSSSEDSDAKSSPRLPNRRRSDSSSLFSMSPLPSTSPSQSDASPKRRSARLRAKRESFLSEARKAEATLAEGSEEEFYEPQPFDCDKQRTAQRRHCSTRKRKRRSASKAAELEADIKRKLAAVFSPPRKRRRKQQSQDSASVKEEASDSGEDNNAEDGDSDIVQVNSTMADAKTDKCAADSVSELDLDLDLEPDWDLDAELGLCDSNAAIDDFSKRKGKGERKLVLSDSADDSESKAVSTHCLASQRRKTEAHSRLFASLKRSKGFSRLSSSEEEEDSDSAEHSESERKSKSTSARKKKGMKKRTEMSAKKRKGAKRHKRVENERRRSSMAESSSKVLKSSASSGVLDASLTNAYWGVESATRYFDSGAQSDDCVSEVLGALGDCDSEDLSSSDEGELDTKVTYKRFRKKQTGGRLPEFRRRKRNWNSKKVRKLPSVFEKWRVDSDKDTQATANGSDEQSDADSKCEFRLQNCRAFAVLHIASFLDIHDVCRVAQTCKTLRDAFDSSMFWAAHCNQFNRRLKCYNRRKTRYNRSAHGSGERMRLEQKLRRMERRLKGIELFGDNLIQPLEATNCERSKELRNKFGFLLHYQRFAAVWHHTGFIRDGFGQLGHSPYLLDNPHLGRAVLCRIALVRHLLAGLCTAFPATRTTTHDGMPCLVWSRAEQKPGKVIDAIRQKLASAWMDDKHVMAVLRAIHQFGVEQQCREFLAKTIRTLQPLIRIFTEFESALSGSDDVAICGRLFKEMAKEQRNDVNREIPHSLLHLDCGSVANKNYAAKMQALAVMRYVDVFYSSPKRGKGKEKEDASGSLCVPLKAFAMELRLREVISDTHTVDERKLNPRESQKGANFEAFVDILQERGDFNVEQMNGAEYLVHYPFH